MKAASLVFALALGVAGADTLSQGTVGSRAVVVQLNGPDDSKYFYLNQGLDITLDVQDSGNASTLTERLASWDQGPDGSYTKVTGRLLLTRRGSTYSGTWQSPDGKRSLPVRLKFVDTDHLRPVLPDSPLLKKWRQEDPYTFLKLNRAFLSAGRKDGLTWVREPLSGLTYPSLAGQPGGAVLQDRLLDAANNALSCQSDLGVKDNAGDPAWKQHTTVTYRSARLLSLTDDVNFFCGGAHPDAYTDGLILDLKTGQALTPAALWPKLTKLELHRRYLAQYPKGQSAECRGAIQDEGTAIQDDPTPYAASLTTGGLALMPSYLPHVAQVCAEPVTLSYAGLAPLAGPLAPRR